MVDADKNFKNNCAPVDKVKFVTVASLCVEEPVTSKIPVVEGMSVL